MAPISQSRLDRIKNNALRIIKEATVNNVKAKKIKLIAYYDWKNDSIIVNEKALDALNEECLTYIVVHELIHKITTLKKHDAKFMAKLMSIYSVSDIVKYETEIVAFSVLNNVPKVY